MAGSAANAIAWVAVEQSGPWGAQAFSQSHLPLGVGTALETQVLAAGARPVLIRTPGRHADVGGPRTFLCAYTHPRGPWLVRGEVSDVSLLLDVAWGSAVAGDQSAFSADLAALGIVVTPAKPQLLVCTNGQRDACCALFGRPVAEQAAAAFPGRVWEVTHTGGHRFAPTAVVLPSGYQHGRVSDGASILAAADQHTTSLATLRGRSTWAAVEQTAEIAARETWGELGLDEVWPLQKPVGGSAWTRGVNVKAGQELIEVAHRDGRRLLVTLEARPVQARRESCSKDPVPGSTWKAVGLEHLARR